MNVSCFTALCFFLSQTLCASGALTQEEKDVFLDGIRTHGQYSYEDFKGLVLPHLDGALHAYFEEGFGPLFNQSTHRIPHSEENKHIACFFESIAGCPLEVQEITLASRLLSPSHEKFLPESVKLWAKRILVGQ